MLKKYSTEIKVGALVFTALVLAGLFLWLLGDYTPIGRTYNIYVLYNFAGGVELGTPVRVGGIKVGKVTDIKFLPPKTTEASLRLKLNISKAVKHRVRRDSKFFVNQAGIIGERYIEITSGTEPFPEIPAGATVRGVDPPRIDQLISQGMGVFERVTNIIDENREGIDSATRALAQAGKLLDQITSKLSSEDVRRLRRILRRLDNITADLEVLSRQLRSDLRPTLADVRQTLREARPVLRRANRLMADFDDLAQQVRDLPPDKKDEIKEILGRMTETATQLQDTVARLDTFTAMLQNQYPDLASREKVVEIIRQFLQGEGIRINVGEVKFRTKVEKKQ